MSITTTRKVTITSSQMNFREKVRDTTDWTNIEREAIRMVYSLGNTTRLEVDPSHFYKFTVVSHVDGQEEAVIETANKVIEFMASKGCELTYTV